MKCGLRAFPTLRIYLFLEVEMPRERERNTSTYIANKGGVGNLFVAYYTADLQKYSRTPIDEYSRAFRNKNAILTVLACPIRVY